MLFSACFQRGSAHVVRESLRCFFCFVVSWPLLFFCPALASFRALCMLANLCALACCQRVYALVVRNLDFRYNMCMVKKSRKASFIEKSNFIHNGKYDYSMVNYINAKTAVTIICPKHGEFCQVPDNHINTKGCKLCSRCEMGNLKKLTTEDFIQKSLAVHSGKYDYSKTIYTGSKNKITIICNVHGSFEQIPNRHLSGSGCRKCGRERTANSKRLSTSDFIKKAKAMHGSKYDYSKVDYIDSKTKVTPICDIHGEFLQTPNDHLSGYGCVLCNKNKSYKFLNTTEFVKEAKLTHGERYDYSESNYNSKEKIIIICKVHGKFSQSPKGHCVGLGCCKCIAESLPKDKAAKTIEFVKKARLVHGDRYDYRYVNYTRSLSKVVIICGIHGEFFQTPKYHALGRGCFECGFISISESKAGNTETFISKAREIHKNRYDYSKVDYKRTGDKVTIICEAHGEFEQIAGNHLDRKGCRKCSREDAASSRTSTTAAFTEKAKAIHGSKYNYSKVDYSNSKTKVTIICEVHGEFAQKPSNHLSGDGCPGCRSSKGEIKVREILNKLNIEFSCQKTFAECADKACLRFDFYLPDYNLCIEYDGKQHYEGWWKNPEESLEFIKRRDEIKNKFCEDSGIGLLRIPYFEFSKVEILIKTAIAQPQKPSGAFSLGLVPAV